MAELIDALLTLSRVTRSEVHNALVDLSAIACSIAADLQKTNPERQMKFHIAEGLTVNGDARLLRVVLENLMSNAWKFTGKQPQARIEFGIITPTQPSPIKVGIDSYQGEGGGGGEKQRVF